MNEKALQAKYRIEDMDTLVFPVLVSDPFNRQVLYQAESGYVIVSKYAGLPDWPFPEAEWKDPRLFGARESQIYSEPTGYFLRINRIETMPMKCLPSESLPHMDDTEAVPIPIFSASETPMPSQPQISYRTRWIILIACFVLLWVCGICLGWMLSR